MQAIPAYYFNSFMTFDLLIGRYIGGLSVVVDPNFVALIVYSFEVTHLLPLFIFPPAFQVSSLPLFPFMVVFPFFKYFHFLWQRSYRFGKSDEATGPDASPVDELLIIGTHALFCHEIY